MHVRSPASPKTGADRRASAWYASGRAKLARAGPARPVRVDEAALLARELRVWHGGDDGAGGHGASARCASAPRGARAGGAARRGPRTRPVPASARTWPNARGGSAACCSGRIREPRVDAVGRGDAGGLGERRQRRELVAPAPRARPPYRPRLPDRRARGAGRRRRCRSKRVIRASVCACCSTEMVELAAPSAVSMYSLGRHLHRTACCCPSLPRLSDCGQPIRSAVQLLLISRSTPLVHEDLGSLSRCVACVTSSYRTAESKTALPPLSRPSAPLSCACQVFRRTGVAAGSWIFWVSATKPLE